MAVYSTVKEDIFSSVIVFHLIYFCSSKSKKYFFIQWVAVLYGDSLL